MTTEIGLRVKTFVYHIRKGKNPVQAIRETGKDISALRQAKNALTQAENVVSGKAGAAEELFTNTIVDNMQTKVDEFEKRVRD